MRAKLQIESTDNNAVIMNVVRDEDANKKGASDKQRFSDTPSGRLHFHVNNPEVAKNLKVGDMYYVDFTKAPNPNEAKQNPSQQAQSASDGPGSGTKEQDKR